MLGIFCRSGADLTLAWKGVVALGMGELPSTSVATADSGGPEDVTTVCVELSSSCVNWRASRRSS